LATGGLIAVGLLGCGAEPDQAIKTEAAVGQQAAADGGCGAEEQMVTTVDVVESLQEMLDASDVVAEVEIRERFTRPGPTTAEDRTTYRMARVEVIEAFEGTQAGSVLEVFVTAAIVHGNGSNPPELLSESTDQAFAPGARLILGMHTSTLGAGLELGGGAIVVDGSALGPVDPCAEGAAERTTAPSPRADALYQSVADETPEEVRQQLHELAAR
jgi:hypothetical protein